MTYFTRLFKRDFSAKQRDRAADSGAAFSDGSYPIYSERDAENAENLKNSTSKHSAASVQRHIDERAKELGFCGAEMTAFVAGCLVGALVCRVVMKKLFHVGWVSSDWFEAQLPGSGRGTHPSAGDRATRLVQLAAFGHTAIVGESIVYM
jgi:hypothetical protein